MTPTTMKLVHQPDPSSQTLLFSPSSPIPQPVDADDHLVLIKAASPCRHELLWEVGDPHLFAGGRKPPRVPCPDGAGIIVTAPGGHGHGNSASTSSAFKPGDEVYFSVDYTAQAGCLAEYTIVKTGELALKPKSVDWKTAAAVPLSALTAWQGLFEHGNLSPPSSSNASENKDKKVLVIGAAGSVGSWAVQLAAAAGVASITGVCSSSKFETAKSFGATEVYSYTSFSSLEIASSSDKYDLIFDSVGGDPLKHVWSVIKPNTGMILAVGADDPNAVKPKDAADVKVAKSEWFLVKQVGEQLKAVADLIDQGKCRATVDSEFEFGKFEDAFERVANGQPNGKVIIKVSD